MKHFLIATMFSVALLVACTTPQPDPDNGVSNASYRKALVRVGDNVASITSRLLRAKDSDLSNEKPVHSADWWDAQINELKATSGLVKAALTGESQ